MVGFQADDGTCVVGIAIDAYRKVKGTKLPSLLWFCPNNLRHRGCARNCVSRLTLVPGVLQVQAGTNITPAKADYLERKGLDFVGQTSVPLVTRDSSFLRINLEDYLEPIDIANLSARPLFCNQKRIRQRNAITNEHLKRIERAELQEMRVISDCTITQGNAFGRLLCIWSHENEGSLQTKEYWVQICCFPTCSCDDFSQHHWYKQSFLLCKHLYWVYKNIFCLEICTNLLLIQPVWTVGELKKVLEQDTEMS
jgi:hypothetical protein